MRKLFIGSLILLFAALGWSGACLGNQRQSPQGELRVVDPHPWNWVYITLNVFEHLLELDKDGKLVPRLATQWQWLDEHTLNVTLRQGVTFHNGELFDAEIVKLNWEENLRRRQPHVVGSFMNFAPEARLDIIDPYTVRFIFPEPDGGALVKLSFMHIANREFYRNVGWREKSW